MDKSKKKRRFNIVTEAGKNEASTLGLDGCLECGTVGKSPNQNEKAYVCT